MASRRVAYVTPLPVDERSYLGEGERYLLNLARGIVGCSRGAYELELITFGESSLRRPLDSGITLRILATARRPRTPLDVMSWELPEAIREADLVHVHHPYTRCGEMALLVAKQQQKPICVTDHGDSTSALGQQVGALELADRIIAYSDFGASLYRTRTPVEVIKGGVDASRFTPPPRNIERDRVLYVGRLLPHKGIDRLIAALPEELLLTVIGPADHADYLHQLQALAAGKRVEFVMDSQTGDETTVRQLYRQAWACVLSSVYQDCYGQTYVAPELMGVTLLEAMSCGTPAVCSRVGGTPEFVRDGETGFVFNDEHELTGRLRLLVQNPSLVEQLGQQARRVVEREYDLTVAGAKLLAIYDVLIGAAQELAA
jgi:glycosyltransferase involved in cell wall biosynthesis